MAAPHRWRPHTDGGPTPMAAPHPTPYKKADGLLLSIYIIKISTLPHRDGGGASQLCNQLGYFLPTSIVSGASQCLVRLSVWCVSVSGASHICEYEAPDRGFIYYLTGCFPYKRGRLPYVLSGSLGNLPVWKICVFIANFQIAKIVPVDELQSSTDSQF